MAPSTRHFSFLFFLALLSSLHANARESQFFSKVTSTPNNNNAKETVEVPNKEQPLSQQEQESNSIPETQNGYGLYGHDSSQLPTTTRTTTAAPYTATNHPYEIESGEPNNNYYYNKDAYETDPQGMSDTRFMERGYTTPTNTNNNFYNGDNSYDTQQQGLSDTRFMERGYTTKTNNHYNGANSYNTQQQGMSDTRFLENGKYYYDLNRDDGYRNRYENSRSIDFSNKGYYGNNENSYEHNENSMGGYQNQEEFHESQEEYVP